MCLCILGEELNLIMFLCDFLCVSRNACVQSLESVFVCLCVCVCVRVGHKMIMSEGERERCVFV